MAFERMTQNVMNVSGLPNVISGQGATLKNTFDKSGSDLKTFINNFLTTLESPIAATNIGHLSKRCNAIEKITVARGNTIKVSIGSIFIFLSYSFKLCSI